MSPMFKRPCPPFPLAVSLGEKEKSECPCNPKVMQAVVFASRDHFIYETQGLCLHF